MRRTILIPLGLFVAGTPLAAEPASVRDFPISGFTKLKVEGPYRVHVRTGGKAAAHARGPRDRLDRLVVEVRGDTLVVTSRNNGWSWGSGNKGPVDVDVAAPKIEAVRLTGSGNVDVDHVRAASFVASVAGSGNLSVARIDTPRLSASVTGSGNLMLRGETGRADAEVTGSGNFEGAGLSVNLLTATVTGSGGLVVGPTRVARAAVTGSGDIRIGGRPTCTERKTGSGSIRCGDNQRATGGAGG